MREARKFQWLPANGQRHAVPGGRVALGEEITTLVGEKVTVPSQRRDSDAWLWPTCIECYDAAKDCTHVSLARLHGHR
jgi:hypothetical protein